MLSLRGAQRFTVIARSAALYCHCEEHSDVAISFCISYFAVLVYPPIEDLLS